MDATQINRVEIELSNLTMRDFESVEEYIGSFMNLLFLGNTSYKILWLSCCAMRGVFMSSKSPGT
jgi:hypothetical protein